ncbi:MAG: hypothetical protein AAF846_07870 [Chloroflexota bacterium]
MSRTLISVVFIIVLAGCNLTLDQTLLPTRSSITIPSVTPDLNPDIVTTENSLPTDVYDALPSTVGICFEAAWDAAEQVFVIRTAEEHIRFYDNVDNSRLCRRSIQREPFDFTTEDVLVGTWNRGMGCTASHEIISYQRDDQNQTITIQAQFSTAGDCQYELVRGLWLGIVDAQAYQINLIVTN